MLEKHHKGQMLEEHHKGTLQCLRNITSALPTNIVWGQRSN